MKRAWGFDVSHWNVQSKDGPIIDYGPLIKLKPSFVIVKVTDGAAFDSRHEQHIAAVQQAGLVLGVYHWFWPTLQLQPQLDTFAQVIDKFDPPIIVVDNEQVYKSSKLRDQAKSGDIPMSEAIIPPDQISSKGRQFMRLLRDRYPHKLLLNYTADWFVKTYAKPMSEWLDEFPLWLAAYPYEKPPRFVQSWDEFMALREGLTEQMIRDRMPPGANQWLFWQWGADKLYLPPPYPTHFNIDLNVYNGTPEEFHARFGGQPGGIAGDGKNQPDEKEKTEEKGKSEEKEQPEPVGVRFICTTGQLHIRSRPDVLKETETGKFLFKGDEVMVYEIANGFGRIDPVESRWVGMKFMKPA